MELELTIDQELLRDTAARFVETACPLSTVRDLVDRETGLPPGYLTAAAELGWFAMLVPEEHGGGSVSGDGYAYLAIIAEERGRGLQPGPFVAMNVIAAVLVAAGPTGEQAAVLEAIASGGTVASWVAAGAVDDATPGSSIEATAMAGADGYVLSSSGTLVQYGTLADWFLVTTTNGGGPSQFLVSRTTPGITVEPQASHDVTQRVGSVSFDGVRVPASSVVGEPGRAAGDVERQLRLACVLTTAETVGAMDALFETTRRYAIDRVGFGRPIGSFQAVKHQLADLSLAVESSKAIAAVATRAVQAGDEDAGEIASMAKSWVSDAGIDVAQGCFQIFGGIGFTWEHELHLFLRRITMNSLLYGQSDWHRERICRLHGI